MRSDGGALLALPIALDCSPAGEALGAGVKVFRFVLSCVFAAIAWELLDNPATYWAIVLLGFAFQLTHENRLRGDE